MTEEQEAEVQRLIKDIDVTELMGMLMKHGNRYSRRILKFFRWYCKYMPVCLMCFHAYGIWDFFRHPREMFIPYDALGYDENSTIKALFGYSTISSSSSSLVISFIP